MKKALITFTTTLTIILGFILPPAPHVFAQEASLFIPFRSGLVQYLSQNAYQESEAIKDQWKRLFFEETHWTENQPFYDPTYEKWADKYYGDYLVFGGGIASSQGVTMTLNPDFSGYFASTLRHNPEFIYELLSDSEHGMNQIMSAYIRDASSKFPKVDEAILEITKDGLYIGTEKNSPVTPTDTNPESPFTIPGGNIMAAQSLDIPVLGIFASNWDSLSQTQIDWALSYEDFLYEDFLAKHDAGTSLAQTTVVTKTVNGTETTFRPLYDLIARGPHGAGEGPYRQEFFNYIIGDPSDTLQPPHGLGQWLELGFSIGLSNAELVSLQTICDIFTDEAHCLNGCSKCGDPAGPANALAYNITFSTSASFTAIRNLVNGNPVAKEAMNDWKQHYEYIHSGSADMLTNSYSIGWSDPQQRFNGWNGAGYTISSTSHVGGTIYLQDKLSSTTSRINVSVTGGSFSMVLYAKDGRALASTSGSGNPSLSWVVDTMTISLLGLSSEELGDSYLVINVTSHASAVVNNSTCTGAHTEASVYSMSLYRTIPNCYKTSPASHRYSNDYRWNEDYSQCVAYAVCQDDRAHTTIAYSTNVIHSSDENNDYYSPVFENNPLVEPKAAVVPKNKMSTASEAIDINDSTKISGNIYMYNQSPGEYYYGEGVVQDAYASIAFSLIPGSIPENANTLTFNMYCGLLSLTLYYDGEPLAYYSFGDQSDVRDRTIDIDISLFSSKQIKGMYAVANMSSYSKQIWCYGSYGTFYQTSARAQLKSIVASY